MAHIVYYTKLGCMTAAKQIKLLADSGHQVDVRDLLAHEWTKEELLSYFGKMPVSEWFNVKSPRVKSGEIDPDAYCADQALELMLADHLLIHRPMMAAGGRRVCGFDPEQVHAWVGLGETLYQRAAGEDFVSCSQPAANVPRCP